MKRKLSFFEFVFIWFKLQKLNLPNHQRIMSKWLSSLWIMPNQPRQALLMAFRNSGKSTIVGLFCAWVLYSDNATRILVIAADYALAKKMVRNVKRIIERHPLTNNLKPDKLDQWASDQFTINRNMELRDPSMLAKGLNANITGLRADLIICDDVEVPKNCDTSEKRHDMREKLSELDYILTPDAMLLYIGTPHTFYTIYQTDFDEGKKETKPFLQGFQKMEIPLLNDEGKSNWPERFSEEKINSIRIRSGENKFLSQMMLKSVNIENSVLDVSRLRSYNVELEITYANNRPILKIGQVKMLSASCWWDPSFAAEKKGDKSVIACVFTGEDGKYYLHDIEYIKIKSSENENIASKQCEIVADFLDRNFLPSIRIESNGIGKFLPGILKEVLNKRKLRIAVLEVFSKENKENKILRAFDVLLADGSIFANQKIWLGGFIEEMREWSFNSSNHDDGLDAVAGCLLSEPIRIANNSPQDSKTNSWQGSSQTFNAQTTFNL